MARSLRVEYSGAVYHVINRGNYRKDLFTDEGTHLAFERCLFEACERNSWELDGFCVMTNHFHLVLRTPMGNLSEGMRWLQSTFANRFNRFRRENGRLFQGRFKSLVVEESNYLGALMDYVHLNPARAGIVSIEHLHEYRWSSYYYLWNKRERPKFLNSERALREAGAWGDTTRGRAKYAEHLCELMADRGAQKEADFDRMNRGWALGTKDFKKSLLERFGFGSEEDKKERRKTRMHFEGEDLAEANLLWWEHCLERCIEATGSDLSAAPDDAKSAEWKVLIAAVLKSRTSAPNEWISERLKMGVPAGVSRSVSLFLKRGKRERKQMEKLMAIITE